MIPFLFNSTTTPSRRSASAAGACATATPTCARPPIPTRTCWSASASTTLPDPTASSALQDSSRRSGEDIPGQFLPETVLN